MQGIMQDDKEVCYLCGREPYWTGAVVDRLEEHHIFGGPRRKASEKYGLKVYLHGIKCHREGEDSAHRSRVTRMALQASAQKRFEEVYGSREEFVKIFGKNYL